MDRLATIDADSLIAELKNDQVRNAFWINVYNAYVQVLLKQHPDWFNTPQLYKKKLVVIAGHKLSLNEVRDDLLRHFKGSFWSRTFKSSFKKQVATDSINYNIHFALNNGREGDPFIAFYVPRRLDRILGIMQETYLQTRCKYYPTRDTVEVPAMIQTYLSDFGGKENLYRMLEDANVIPADKKPVLVFVPVNTRKQLLFSANSAHLYIADPFPGLSLTFVMYGQNLYKPVIR